MFLVVLTCRRKIFSELNQSSNDLPWFCFQCLHSFPLNKQYTYKTCLVHLELRGLIEVNMNTDLMRSTYSLASE